MKIVFTQEIEKKYSILLWNPKLHLRWLKKTLSDYWYDGKLEVLANEDTSYRIVSERGVVTTNIRR